MYQKFTDHLILDALIVWLVCFLNLNASLILYLYSLFNLFIGKNYS